MAQKHIKITDDRICLLGKKQNRQVVLTLGVLNEERDAIVMASELTKPEQTAIPVTNVNGQLETEKTHKKIFTLGSEVDCKGLKGVVADYKEKLNPTAFAYFFEYILTPALGGGIADVELDQVDAEFRAVQVKKENVYAK